MPGNSDQLKISGAESRWQRQRTAAAQNEEAIAAAAARLFGRHDVATVDIRDIAAEAGVGVGTVYRRYGDKANLIAALLGEQERRLQDALLSGSPPVGPGAAPSERLVAFLCALCELTERNLDLLAASEGAAPGARYRIGAYRAWRLHVTVLLRQIDQTLDGEWLAELLLAPLGAAHYLHQRREQGMSAERIEANLTDAALRLAGANADQPAGPQSGG